MLSWVRPLLLKSLLVHYVIATGVQHSVREMTQSDLEQTKKNELCQRAGFKVFNHNE